MAIMEGHRRFGGRVGEPLENVELIFCGRRDAPDRGRCVLVLAADLVSLKLLKIAKDNAQGAKLAGALEQWHLGH